MHENDLLDSLLSENPEDERKKLDLHLAKRRKFFLILLAILTVLNITIVETGLINAPRIFGSDSPRMYSVFTFGIAIWGFILGLLFSLIPYKKAPYGKKYLLVSMIVMAVLDTYFLVMFCLLILLHRN